MPTASTGAGIKDAVKRGGEYGRTAVPAFASASGAAGVCKGLGLQYTKRAYSERLYRVRCRRLPCLGLRFNAGQGGSVRSPPSRTPQAGLLGGSSTLAEAEVRLRTGKMAAPRASSF